MPSNLSWVGLIVGVALILIPEPITTATGTLLGAAIVATQFGVANQVV